ncbi:hypothetical protein AHiyo1_29960 [Arthrobacter sp. Hiyo1]|nr:hypothetical protein AHiyo1_29960 [Arthrobacter sp. Hiyo1]
MRLSLGIPSAPGRRGTVWWVRAALGILGLAALGYALFGFLANVPPAQLIGVAAWLLWRCWCTTACWFR